jgi:glucose/arabinose dehydrogenase/mono/diheme cytochrome c family protein
MIKAAAVLATVLTGCAFLFSSCNQQSSPSEFASDSTTIRAGQLAFSEKCAGCHNFQEDGIGPHLAGVTDDRPVSWLKSFIRDPKKMIDSGDSTAKKLYREFRTMMPSFSSLPDAELNSILAFIHTHKKTELHLAAEAADVYFDPITDSIRNSGIRVAIQEIAKVPFSSNQPPLTRIIKMDYMPVTNELFIADLRGKLYRIVNDSTEVFMDMQKLRPKFINQPGLATGFGSFAFHPEYQTNGLMYTTHTESAGAGKADFGYHDSIKVELQWVLTEWKVQNVKDRQFKGKGRELMRVNMPTGIHGVQEITFNKFARKGHPDYGLLYVGIGDGGSTELRHFLITEKPNVIWGSIIRIDPAGRNSKNGSYGIPATNPFVKDGNAVPEIYAWGFRNPHKINWSRDGRMFTANVGELNIEALYLVEPGRFYGWPLREGGFLIEFAKNKRKVLPLPANDSSFNITYPVAQFDHDEGTAITGGFEYQGSNVPQLKGKYVFGDMGTARLFFVEMDDIKQGNLAEIKTWNISMNGKPTTLLEQCGTSRTDMRFGMDASGELYLFAKQNGKIYKLVNAETD